MRALTTAFCFFVALIGAGCTFAAPERKLESAVHAQQDVAVTSNQLRLRMRSLVGPMCGEIEHAADQIIAGTSNDAVKRAALRWKIGRARPARGVVRARSLYRGDRYLGALQSNGGLLRTRPRERSAGGI